MKIYTAFHCSIWYIFLIKNSIVFFLVEPWSKLVSIYTRMPLNTVPPVPGHNSKISNRNGYSVKLSGPTIAMINNSTFILRACNLCCIIFVVPNNTGIKMGEYDRIRPDLQRWIVPAP